MQSHRNFLGKLQAELWADDENQLYGADKFVTYHLIYTFFIELFYWSE